MISLKQLDYYYNLREACKLAEELGYYLYYLDGALCPKRYAREMIRKINSLVKKSMENWPKEVNNAFSTGCTDGQLDT